MTIPANPISDTYRAGDASILAWAKLISDFYNAYVNTGASRLYEPSDFLNPPASGITYSGATSGLASTDVQDAIDETVALIDTTVGTTISGLAIPIAQEPLLAGIADIVHSNGITSTLPAGVAAMDGHLSYDKIQSAMAQTDVSATSTTTLADHPTLRFIAGGLTGYHVQLHITYTADAAGDLKIGFGTPGFGVLHISSARLDGSDTAVLVDENTVSVIAGGAGATVRSLVIDAILIGGLGTAAVPVKFAQGTSSATATVIKANSILTATPVATLQSYGRGNEILHVACLGDSLTEGATANSAVQIADPWPRRLRRMLCGMLGLPDAGPGFRPNTHTTNATEWSYTGTWTATGTGVGDKTVGWNKFPNFATRLTTDNSAIAKWTKPTDEALALYCELVYVDGPSAGDIQVRFDGGPWLVLGLTMAHDNSLKTIYVPSPFTSTVEFRNNQSGGTFYPVGASFFSRFSGLVVDNYGLGRRTAQEQVGGSNGADAYAITAIYPPRLTFIGFGANEAIFGDTETGNLNAYANFRTNMDTIVARFQAFGDVIVWNAPPENPSDGLVNPVRIAGTQAAALACAQAHKVPYLNFGTAWQSWTAANTATLMADDFHPNDLGHQAMANWFMRLMHTML